MVMDLTGYLRRILNKENEVFLFPNVSNVTVTFTAGGVANAFGAWVEIVDSLAVTFSSVFAAQAGHLSGMMVYQFSVANEIWIIEISYGAAHTIIARQNVRSDWTYLLDLLSREVPAGETVYYRAMSETALATVLVNFRYFYV
jgi:hypothetical protein